MGRPLPSPLPRRLAGLLIAVAVVARDARAADPPPVLATAREVAESYRLAEPRPDVDLEAVVLGTIPRRSILLRDDTGTTFATVPYAGPPVEPGDRVRVRGRPSTGALIDGIGDATVERLGAGPPPAPRLIHARDLTTGECFHDLITVSGVGRLVREDATVGTVVLVHTDGGTVEVRCERPLAAAEAARLVDAELAITGFGGGEVNLARQIVRPFLRVVSADGLRVVGPAPADPFAVDDVPLDRIDRSIRSGHRVKVRGVASAPGGTGGGVFIAAGDRGLFIEPVALDATVRRIAPGDLVEAVGFPAADAAAMYLAAATLRVVGRGEPPRPRLLPDQAVFPETSDWFDYFRTVSCDALPIAVEIEVDSLRDEPAGVELHGHMPLRRIMFACHVPAGLPRSVGPGSHILVRGVCRVTATMRDRYIAFPSAFDVWPASAADVVVVKAVPWWTRGEVVAALRWLLAGFALVAVAATTLVILLRRTVRRQVALLEQKRQNEAVLEERQRIAREVHDSLEQDLAGLALRLDATASTAADDRLRGHEHARGGDRPRRRGQRPVGCGPG
jgi:hypothetical protein